MISYFRIFYFCSHRYYPYFTKFISKNFLVGVHVNGVVFSKRKHVGIGVVIHDSLGEVVAALSKNMALSLGALETEAKALEEGI